MFIIYSILYLLIGCLVIVLSCEYFYDIHVNNYFMVSFYVLLWPIILLSMSCVVVIGVISYIINYFSEK